MRREWRNVLAAAVFLLGSTYELRAQPELGKQVSGPLDDAVRMTVEIIWEMPQKGVGEAVAATRASRAETNQELSLELSRGRIVEAVSCAQEGSGRVRLPGERSAARLAGPDPNGSWRLGHEAEGRARARLEAPLDASVFVRAGDQVVSIPLAAVLERPQHTPPQASLIVSVARLAWDSLGVDLGEPGADGIVAPGTIVPLSIAFNILSPETSEVALRATATLRSIRGGDALWRSEQREVVPANRLQPAARTWNLPAPRSEGTYVLEVRAAWEPTAHDGSRLGRFIRRRKPAAVASFAVRRVLLTVLDPSAGSAPTVPSAPDRHSREIDVDALDLSRLRTLRPLASGRWPTQEPGGSIWQVPAEALIEPSRRDRLRGWILRTGAEASRLDPPNSSGLAWSAVGLKVAHPERTHRLTLRIKGGEPAALGVALVEPGKGPSDPPRLVLDACASGSPVLPDGPPVAFNWLVWPNATELVLVLVNRGTDAPVRLGSVTLTELKDVSPGSDLVEPGARAGRVFGLYLSGAHALDPFGADPASHDYLTIAHHLVEYMRYCGASAVVLPEDLADRSSRRALGCQADEDSTGPDRLETIRRVLARHGSSCWLELDFDGPGALPGLPPVGSVDAAERGLVRVDTDGQPDGPAYHPLHPEVRESMKQRIRRAVTMCKSRSGDGAGTAAGAPGLLLRLGHGPTLLGTPDTGLDDATFERFVLETFRPDTAGGIPGMSKTDPERFSARARYVAGVGRMPWLTWRARAVAALYSELAQAAQEVVSGTVVAVVTPVLDSGPASAEAHRIDRAGLAPSQAWRSVGLDLRDWPSGVGAPIVLRGVSLSRDALAHDLAVSPDLDALVAGRPQKGMLLSIDGESTQQPGTAPNGRRGPPRLRSSSRLASDAVSSGRAGSDQPARGIAPVAPPLCLTALPLGSGLAADEPLGHSLAALDARWVFLAGKAIAGHEDRARRFAAVLRALPAWPAASLIAPGDLKPKAFGIAVRGMGDDAQTFLAIANDSPYPIRLATLLGASNSALVEDLGRGLRLLPPSAAGGWQLVLDLPPFGTSAIRVGEPRVQLLSLLLYPSEAALSSMQARFDELTAQLAWLNRNFSTIPAEPPNPGFELTSTQESSSSVPPGSPSTETKRKAPERGGALVGGWRLEADVPGKSTMAFDHENPHSGEHSLRLSCRERAASVVSESFRPNAQSSLTVQVFLRVSAAADKVRVWIEGESSGQAYIRRTELSTGPHWEEFAVRASDIPAEGLDFARLRFELLAPGSLWIDDVRIENESATKSARINAQRTLLAALQAYREHRYNDFARLARSHWIRESNTLTIGRLAHKADVPAHAAIELNTSSSGAGSALPPERKLR
jgi:hypothetical protein